MAKGTKSNAAVKKAGAKKGAKKGLKRDQKAGVFTTYLKRLAKKGGKKVALSGKALKVLHSFATDLFDKLATEAAALARSTKKATLGASEVQTAVRLSLPTELAQHAMSEASKAVSAVSK
jgi:histone H2B